MSTLRARLDRAEDAAAPPSLVFQIEGAHGMPPSDAEVAARVAEAAASGSRATVIRFLYDDKTPIPDPAPIP